MRRLLLSLLLLLLAPVAHAQELAGPTVRVQEGSARLVAARVGGAPMLGLDLTLTPGWHTYWQNPGDSGIPPRIMLLSPPTKSPAPVLHFPVPERFETAGIVDFGYHDALLLPLSFDDVDPFATPVRIKATWLVCKDICLPESAELDFDAASAEPAPARLSDALARATPSPAPAAKTTARYNVDAERVWIDLPGVDATPQQLYPIRPAGMIALSPPGEAEPLAGGGTRLVFPIGPEAGQGGFDFLLGSPGQPGSFATAAFDAFLPFAPRPVEEDAPSPQLPVILLLAFLGGLLLNVMPCVLPILSLKIFALIEHPGGRRGAIAQGLGYLLGIETCFLILAGALLILKAGGQAIGWGYQLQSPSFLAMLAIIVFLTGLNLSGFLPWNLAFFGGGGAPRDRKPHLWIESFQTGILAVLVATPCTAPFMASALGAALVLPALPALLVFVFLGAGMACPFLLVSLFPRLRHALPRPGAWMATLKHALAFPMYATAAWLLWLLAVVGGTDALGIGLVLLLLAVTGLLLLRLDLGRYARTTLTFLLLLAFLLLSGRLPAQGAATHRAGGEPYSAARLTELREAGRPVLVNATASWCLTCKVNERVALASDEVQRHLAERKIVVLTADWTKGDAAITGYLASLGRSGVPAYVFYPPRGEPRLLPQILTPGVVVAETR